MFYTRFLYRDKKKQIKNWKMGIFLYGIYIYIYRTIIVVEHVHCVLVYQLWANGLFVGCMLLTEMFPKGFYYPTTEIKGWRNEGSFEHLYVRFWQVSYGLTCRWACARQDRGCGYGREDALTRQPCKFGELIESSEGKTN